MNAPHPITHWWGSLLAATMTTLLIMSMLLSFALAENTDQIIQQQQQQQQRSVAAERKQNEHLSTKITSSSSSTNNVVGSNNNRPYPPRPSSVIRIDLDDLLRIMDNITATSSSTTTAAVAVDTIAKSDHEGTEKFNVPKNPAVENFPEKRFSLWSELTSPEKQYAIHGLNYNEYTWDNPHTNPIESLPFSQLSNKFKSGLSLLEISPSQWDCHVNHYYGYYWDDLMKAGLDVHFSMLGWDQESWDYENVTKPLVEWMRWNELSEKQKVIAKELCYFRETWDELPLSEWVVEWRRKKKLNERESSTSSSSKGVSK